MSPAPRKVVAWDTVDWSLPRNQIALQLGVTGAAVTRKARLLGKPVQEKISHASFDRATLDWTKSLKELTAETGISRSTLYQWREKAKRGGLDIPALRRKCPWRALVGPSRRDLVALLQVAPIGTVLWLPITQADAAGLAVALEDRRLITHSFRATPKRRTIGEVDLTRITVAKKLPTKK